MDSGRCVIFDVDGTLTASTGVDDDCLVEAWRRIWGAGHGPVDTDWSKWEHSTDEGLSAEVCRKWLGRGPTREEMDRVRREFFGLLRQRISAEPAQCAAVGGVNELLAALRGAGWRVGIASGAWEASARIKLESARVNTAGLPGTFAHARADGEPARREEIVGKTLEELGGGRAVYVGDGVWDARAARALGIGFVGVRADGREEKMRAEGVTRILRDYRDTGAAMAAIRSAIEE